MEPYKCGMIPGPSGQRSADIDDEFYELYDSVTKKLEKMLYAPKGSAVVMVGEGMLALWAGLKSTLKPGDKVLSVATGIYGYGIADMCRDMGAVVEVVGTEYNETVSDGLLNQIRTKAEEFKPKLITAVHCETPSGTLNDRLGDVGKISASVGSLFYVDFVSSGMGAHVNC
eukprot:CAMPEP_0168508790 /NCGR_PEP_ID=MMETSP0405-20121227/347_1 /TAXON_ID=498012 /ORGANISM="Trichosphaerium sp, Strain Am-I-7 wt" /LENGTH=170 /DNA_ID=CAMNT_0008526039 /DNA_START=1142 /DNA_END=1654 /DNA_ORIENTATION=+